MNRLEELEEKLFAIQREIEEVKKERDRGSWDIEYHHTPLDFQRNVIAPHKGYIQDYKELSQQDLENFQKLQESFNKPLRDYYCSIFFMNQFLIGNYFLDISAPCEIIFGLERWIFIEKLLAFLEKHPRKRVLGMNFEDLLGTRVVIGFVTFYDDKGEKIHQNRHGATKKENRILYEKCVEEFKQKLSIVPVW